MLPPTEADTPVKDNRVRINDNYDRFEDLLLGSGGFGKTYLGINRKYKYYVAIKRQSFSKSKTDHLKAEAEILRELKGGAGIPELYDYKKGHYHSYLIMELLGENLYDLFKKCRKKFSLKTVCEIAYQAIHRLKYIHSRGYVHRDIKPTNIVIGKWRKKKIIYIIDYGLSKKYIIHYPGGAPLSEGKAPQGITGTTTYASLFTHYGFEASRRDDVESLAYTLIYFAKGGLPWEKSKIKTGKDKHRTIMHLKEKYTPEELCKGLPPHFSIFLKGARNLEFDEMPDYENLKQMFLDCLHSLSEKLNRKFDWDIFFKKDNTDEEEKEDDEEEIEDD